MNRELQQQHPENVTIPLSIAEGGTGAKTPQQALTNFEAIPLIKVGQANGITPLNASGKIPPQYLAPGDVNSVSLSGPYLAYLGLTTLYTITDFDFDTTYTLTTDYGTVTRNREVISYQPSQAAFALGTHAQGFMVNDTNYPINVVETSISKPSILSPLNNSSGLGSPLSIQVSDFVYIGPVPNSYTLVCQIATSNDFSSIVQNLSIVSDTLINTSLPNAPYYYLRAKYQAPGYSDSEWSDTITINSFLTLPIHPTAILYETGGVYNDDFGSVVAINNDGSRVFASAPGHMLSGPGSVTGSITIFKKNNLNTLVEESVLTIPDSYTGYNFGNAFTISDAGDVLITCAGAFYIYKLVNNVWTFITEVSPPTTCDPSVCANHDGSLFACSDNQVIYVYAFDGTIATLSATLTLTKQTVNVGYVFNALSMSDDGTTIICGIDNDGDQESGKVYVWNYANSTWTQTQEIYPEDPSAGNWGQCFGHVCKINKAGDLMVVGDLFSNVTNLQNDNIYTFKLENSVWVQKSKFNYPNTQLTNELTDVSFNSDASFIVTGLAYTRALPVNATNNTRGSGHLHTNTNGVLPNVFDYLIDEFDYPLSSLDYTWFGTSIAISADGSTVAVGAPSAVDPNAHRSGAVFIYT